MIAAAIQPREENMAATHVYAGAARSMGGTLGGIFRQAVGDNGWEHLTNGVPEGAEVHAITVHPENPDVVYIGTTKGTYRSTNRGTRWEKLNLPDPDADIWSVCIHPKNPRTIYAGATPPGVYRSDDGGDTWRKMADPGLPDRVIMAFACRVMRLDIDPNSPDDVYATLEANGAMRSRNRGDEELPVPGQGGEERLDVGHDSSRSGQCQVPPRYDGTVGALGVSEVLPASYRTASLRNSPVGFMTHRLAAMVSPTFAGVSGYTAVTIAARHCEVYSPPGVP